MNSRSCPRPNARNNLTGSIVRRFRETENLSQQALVEALQRKGWDMDRSVLVRIESGKRTLLDYELEYLLKVLGKDWTDLATELQSR